MSTRGGTKADLWREITRLQAENARLRHEIERIAYPILSLQRECDEGGRHRLNGAAAVALSDDPRYLSDIAVKALAPPNGL